ncbi:MAG: AAA family ATPase [Planctomycetota bacterium]|nr:AAA family ATPase [Planctomycetota bacterium]
MRLVKIKPTYFRGFGDSDWINLDAGLVVLHGPNGQGKTSLAEAVEWLLYGKTRRRERGENLSQRDYQDSYRNIHVPAGVTTSVEAVLRASQGSEHTVRRELVVHARSAETSRTFIDGNPADLTAIGISTDEVFNPVIAQDGLQDLIHSKPKERRDKISAALGLEPLVRFKTVVDRARTRFQSSPPPVVVQARTHMGPVVTAMTHSARVAALAQRWQSERFEERIDCAELHQAALAFLQMQRGDRDAITEELNLRRREAAQRVFDDTAIQVSPHLEADLQTIERQRGSITVTVNALGGVLTQFTGAAASVYELARLCFWQTGLQMQTAGPPDTCPMCEAPTLTQAKREEIQRRIDRSANYTRTLGALQEQGRAAAKFVRSLMDSAGRVFPRFLGIQERRAVTVLFADSPATCATFLAAHDSAQAAYQRGTRFMDERRLRVESIQTLAANPGTVHEANQLVAALAGDLDQAVQRLVQCAREYAAAHAAFSPHLANRIASHATVRQIDGLLAPITNWHYVHVLSENRRLLQESLDVQHQIEAHIQAKQAALFQTRGQEINTWYDMLNPGARVRYTRMEPGTDSLMLWGETFGVQINAVACLSQCQLNCLGLSIHLIRALTPGTPFRFVLMDDPVQSMDDDHCQALMVDVINSLLSRNLQVIVLSHEQGLVDGIWETYYHVQPLRLRISDFVQNGPVIEDAETLGRAIERAQTLARGNEDNRRLSVKVLRRCAELLIRGACKAAGSTSPPCSATAAQMLPFFQSCPSTISEQHQGLRATIGFSAPAPHTQPGWPVPVLQQIQPHLDRIRQTARQLNVV